MNGRYFFFSRSGGGRVSRRTCSFPSPSCPALISLFSPTDAAKTSLSPPAGSFCLLIFDAVLCLVFFFFFPLPYHLPSALISILDFISASFNSLSLFFSLFFPQQSLFRQPTLPLHRSSSHWSRQPLICVLQSRLSGELCCRTAASPRLPASCPSSCGSMPVPYSRVHTHTHTCKL